MIHENEASIQQIEPNTNGKFLKQKQSIDYFDLNAQVFHLLLFKNLNFITDALIFEEITSYLANTIPICNFQRVNLSLHQDVSISEVITAFSFSKNQWDSAEVLLLENLRLDQLEELDTLSNIRFIGFMNQTEFASALNNAANYRKLVFLEYSTGICKPYIFPDLRSEQELTDYYIQYGSFATADKITEIKQRAQALYELFLEKGKSAISEITSMIERYALEEHAVASLLQFTESFFDLKPGCFEFINICQKNVKNNIHKEKNDEIHKKEQNKTIKMTLESEHTENSIKNTPTTAKEILMNVQDLLNDTQIQGKNGSKFEGLTAIWNEELGPIVIDQYPTDSQIEKETLAIQFFMTFETVFGQSPMKKTELILPLAAFNKTAIIHLDLLENESVRGGKQPFIITILVPESFSLIQINTIKPYIENAIQVFKSEHTSSLELLIESISPDLINHGSVPQNDKNEKESKADQNNISIDISQHPKILPKIEKEVKTLNQLNKLPNNAHENQIDGKIFKTPEPIKAGNRCSNESEGINEDNTNGTTNHAKPFLSSPQQTEAINKDNTNGTTNHAKPFVSSSQQTEAINKDNTNGTTNHAKPFVSSNQTESTNPIEQNTLSKSQIKKNSATDINKHEQTQIIRETILKIKNIIDLPVPDYRNMKQMEDWFEAKNHMLRLFFESGIAEL